MTDAEEMEAERFLRELAGPACPLCGYHGRCRPGCAALRDELARDAIAALNRVADGLHAIANAHRRPKPVAPFAVGDTVRCRSAFWPAAMPGCPRVGVDYVVTAVALYDEATGDPLPHPMLRLEGFDGAWNCEGFESAPDPDAHPTGEPKPR